MKTPRSNTTAHRAIRTFLAVIQVVATLSGVVVGITQPTLPGALSAFQSLLGSPQIAAAAGGISGTVYRDFNSNGVKDALETAGLAGVTVTAYDATGTAVATTTSGPNGAYTLAISAVANGTGLRIEFSNLPTGFQSSYAGGSSVQFVTAGAVQTVNFAVNVPSDYCQSNPDFVIACYRNGANTTGVPALYKFNNTSSGVGAPPTFATNTQVGSVWGLAYQRESKTVFSSAVLKRHVGLGPNGLGAIYKSTYPAAVTSLFVDVTTIGVNVGQASVLSNGARGLQASLTASNLDASTFAQIGKYGIGDIDISDDGKPSFSQTCLIVASMPSRSATRL